MRWVYFLSIVLHFVLSLFYVLILSAPPFFHVRSSNINQIIEQPLDRFTETHFSVLIYLLEYHFPTSFAISSLDPSLNGEQAEQYQEQQETVQNGDIEMVEVDGEEAVDIDGEEMVEEQEFDDEVRGGEGAVDDEEVAND